MSVSLGASPIILIVLLLAAGAVTWWTYMHSTPRVPMGWRILLTSLRFATLFLILLLLFQPILRMIEREEQPPVLAVLLDDSQSLSLETETGLNLPLTVRDAVNRIPFGNLDGDTRYYRFSGSAERISRSETPTGEELTFEGSRTDISQALEFVREDLSRENLQGVLLLSDGLYNTGRNPLYTAERYPVPIHTVVAGDTTEQRDVLIRRVVTNDIAYVDVELPLEVSIRARGYEGETANIRLFSDGQEVDRTSITFHDENVEERTVLSFTPSQAGLQQVTLTVTEFPDEITHENNRETVSMRVLESRRQILMLADAPNPDMIALRQVLRSDGNVELTVRTQRTADTFYEGPFPDAPGDFDAVILLGYPGQSADPEVVNRVAAAANDGTPLFFILSRRTHVPTLIDNFGELLPVTPSGRPGSFTEVVPRITPAGQAHPILQIEDIPSDSWNRLPPLAYDNAGWQATPDARVLAGISVRGTSLDHPLIAVRQRGDQRSVAFLGAGLWRWLNLPPDLDIFGAFLPEILANTMQWVTTQEDDRPVRVEPVESLFAGDENVLFTGQVYDESLNPVNHASVEVTVTDPEGNRFPHTMQFSGNGRYDLDIGVMPAGEYTYEAAAEIDGTLLGSDAGSFAVGPLNLEFRETRADAGLMRQIAERSGGTFYFPDEAGAVASTLSQSEGFAAILLQTETELELRHFYTLLGIIIILLTTEWFFRKRAGMV